MGSVIGKGGSKIKEIQEASGARLQASEAMLPGSTEVCWSHPSIPIAQAELSPLRSAFYPYPESQTLSTLLYTMSVLSYKKSRNERPQIPNTDLLLLATVAPLLRPMGELPLARLHLAILLRVNTTLPEDLSILLQAGIPDQQLQSQEEHLLAMVE
jgi:hypothetical protein